MVLTCNHCISTCFFYLYHSNVIFILSKCVPNRYQNNEWLYKDDLKLKTVKEKNAIFFLSFEEMLANSL